MALPHVGIVEACDDESLFNFPLYPRQRELLSALEAGPRLHIWALGRRSGKTTLAAITCLHNLLFRGDLDAAVRPGERRYAVAVATNLQQAKLLVQAARAIIEGSELLAELVDSVTEDAISFANGTELRAFPCSSRGGRGWPVSCLVMDEAAHFVSDTDGYQTAERVYGALLPSVAQFGDAARIIVSSTPYGDQGLFAELFRGADEDPDAEAHHATTTEANPTIDPAVLERERDRDVDVFRSEYLAEFVAGGDAYIDMERVEVADRGPLEPDQATDWIAGLDPAFSKDPFGLALVGCSDDRLVLGFADALKPPRLGGKGATYERHLEEIVATCKRFGATAVTDQYAAPAVLSHLRNAGLEVREHPMTATTKTAIFSELRARLYDGSLQLYQHKALIAELGRLRTRFAAGSAAVQNPRVGGSHGDIAQALALAVYEQRDAARRGPNTVLPSFLDVSPAAFNRAVQAVAGGRDWRTAIDDSPRARHGSPGHRLWSTSHFCAECFEERGDPENVPRRRRRN